jgi:uncharacterized membrane protein YqjE
MNRAILIIGVLAVGVTTFYVAAFWGRWAATIVAIALLLLLAMVAFVDRRRVSRRATPAGRS